MTEKDQPRQSPSDVLGAIFDKVEGPPAADRAAPSGPAIYRQRAIDQLDVATEVDNQLPLVSRRSWLLLAGAALVTGAFLVWAALTPSVSSVSAQGRVLNDPGLFEVVAPVAGALVADEVDAGDSVVVGQTVAIVQAPDGRRAPVASLGAGVVWQIQSTPGDAVEPGSTLLTLIPVNSGDSLLIAVPELQSTGITPGMRVETPFGTSGTVDSLDAPLPGSVVGRRLGLALEPGANYAIAVVGLASSTAPGTPGQATIVLSEETVFDKFLGRS